MKTLVYADNQKQQKLYLFMPATHIKEIYLFILLMQNEEIHFFYTHNLYQKNKKTTHLLIPITQYKDIGVFIHRL
jgi:hypothetical protein